MSLVLVVAVVAALGVATTAQAAARLTVKDANQLARKLGRKQVRRHEVKVFRLGKPRRLARNAVAFPYQGRTKANTFCRGRLTVTKRGSTITARIGSQRCRRMPKDALAFEAATRKAVKSLRPRATRRAVRRVERSIARCEDLKVPKPRRAAAAAVVDVAMLGAVSEPNARALQRFVTRLRRIRTTHGVLGRASDAWESYFDAQRALPSFPYPCATLRRWSEAGWDSDEAPIDMEFYRDVVLVMRFDASDQRRAARYLRRVGVAPKLAAAFTARGLVMRLG